MGRLILLPGLGADSRLLAPQKEAFPNLVIPAWRQPRPSESLHDYAGRFADVLALGPDDILGGISFGGMLSLEMAKLRAPRALILISTCRNPQAITAPVRRFATLARFPLPNAAARLAPMAIPILGPMDAEHRRLLTEMAATTSMSFLRWGAQAIFGWAGVPSLAAPTLHIHGRRDRVISCKAVRPDVIIDGAGHVANLTHAESVNAAIRDFTSKLAPQTSPAFP